MRLFLILLLFPVIATAQETNVRLAQIVDFVRGPFGDNEYEESRAMLVTDDEGVVDLYIFEGDFYRNTDLGDPVVYTPYFTGLVKYPPELSLLAGGGFAISQSQGTTGWGSWTSTSKIAKRDGGYFYIGSNFYFRNGLEPYDGVNCEYDYEIGVVVVTVYNEDEEIVSVEDYNFDPVPLRELGQQTDYALPAYSAEVIEKCDR